MLKTVIKGKTSKNKALKQCLTWVWIPAFWARSRPCTPALFEITKTISEEQLFTPVVLSIKAWRLVPENRDKTKCSNIFSNYWYMYFKFKGKYLKKVICKIYAELSSNIPDPEMSTPTLLLRETLGTFQQLVNASCRFSIITLLSPTERQTWFNYSCLYSCFLSTFEYNDIHIGN